MISISNPTPNLYSGQTGLDTLKGFVVVQTAGAREVAQKLYDMAKRALEDPDRFLEKAAIEASRPLKDGYKSRVVDATGNLRKSVTTARGRTRYPGVGIAVTGPRLTGTGSATESGGSGNHAWIIEFGTPRRRPGTNNRRTYVNVHQAINGRMSRRQGPINGAFDDEQFARAGKGYYFLMGSLRERGGPGTKYSRDFAGPGEGGDGRPQHPITLQPGQTIAGVPAQHIMQKTIAAEASNVQSLLMQRLNHYINTLAS